MKCKICGRDMIMVKYDFTTAIPELFWECLYCHSEEYKPATAA